MSPKSNALPLTLPRRIVYGLRIVNNQVDEYEEIHRVTHKARGDGQGKTKMPPQLCRFCAFKHVLQKEKCPAWGKTCDSCGQKNHFAKSELCHGKRGRRRRPHQGWASQRNVHAVAEDSDSDSSTQGVISTVAVATVSASAEEEERPLYCKMLIDDKEVLHQIDPEATVCVLPVSYVGNRKVRSEKVSLKMWNSSTQHALGRCKIKVRNCKTKEKWHTDYIIVEHSSGRQEVW